MFFIELRFNIELYWIVFWYLFTGSLFGSLDLSVDSEMMGLDWDHIDMFPLTPVVVNSPATAAISATFPMDAEPRKCQWF